MDLKNKNFSNEIISNLTEAYINPIFDFPPIAIDGLIETIEEIQKLDLKIGLISNTGRTPGNAMRKILKNIGILKYFHTLTFSNELKIRKPDKNIFIKTLNNMHLTPKEVIHVGDNIVTDIWGAKKIGMISILFSKDELEFTDIVPDYKIKKLKDLIDIIKSTHINLNEN